MRRQAKRIVKQVLCMGEAPDHGGQTHIAMEAVSRDASGSPAQNAIPDPLVQTHTATQADEGDMGDPQVKGAALDPSKQTHPAIPGPEEDLNDPVVQGPTPDPSGQAHTGMQATGKDVSDLEAEGTKADLEVQEDPEIIRLRKLCPRFRVLIIGRANSGKTTIIQKMCRTTDVPIVRDRDGNEVDPKALGDATAMRGEHDIDLEITYPSNPHFVFHDSRGFEAGSADELEKVIEFIGRKSGAHELKDRLHVIWYCIPMDGDRVLSTAERSFFEHGTGDVPVIALFTKWDGQVTKAFNKLYDTGTTGMSARDAFKQAPELAMKTFREHYLPVVLGATHPPKDYVQLGDMHEPETSCSELSEKALKAMDSDILKKIFVSVQQTNIQLTMKYALNDVLDDRKGFIVKMNINYALS